MRKRSTTRRVLRVFLSIVIAVVLAFVALVAYFLLLGQQSAWAQQTRIEELREAPRAAGLAWTESADHSISEERPYDELRVVATHNSYALQPSWLQRAVIDLVDPGEGALLKYEHAPLWDQLEAGIRSFELDVRWNGTDFGVSHVPLVANRSTVPDFALALEEIKIWSDRHPGHLPISVMVEPKSDYMFLDPTLKNFDAAAWDAFDATLTDGLGEKLFTPDDLRDHVRSESNNLRSESNNLGSESSNLGSESSTLRDAVRATGWPRIGEMRDSVLFFLSDNEQVREQYLEGHEALAGRSMFTSSQTPAGDAVFAVRDDPRVAAIGHDVAERVVVRTRADADLTHSEALTHAAFASGAQILSTDFPPSEPQQGTGYFFALTGGALVQVGDR